MNYSKTYIFQLAQFISFGLAMANVQVDPASLETTLTVITTIITGLMVLYSRYTAEGPITALGFRKK